jgi:hypothetical protein
MSVAAASYLPECQVITLKEHFDAFADPNNVRGIQNADELGFFFHEWLHYLHNVSTVQGLSAFANQVGHWQNFRFTIGAEGLSQGSASLSPEMQAYVRQNMAYLVASRSPKRNHLPGQIEPSRVRITAAAPVSTPIGETNASMTTIRCDAVIAQKDGYQQPISLEIGTHEILEGLAVLFETELVRRRGGTVAPTPLAPYRLLELLAKHVAPDLSLFDVTLCALGALQWSDAPGELLSMLAHGQQAHVDGASPTRALLDKALSLLSATAKWREKTLADLEARFPVDDSLSRAVKQTVANFRMNFAARAQNPFFEWELVHEVAQDPSRMDDVIRRHGACAVIQRRPGDADAIDRDLMFDIVTGPADPLLGFGWRKMHASFRFLTLHCTESGFAATRDLQLGERTKCPFYTACSYGVRKAHPEICAREPWKTLDVGDVNGACWYHAAVAVMRRE